MPSKYSAAVFTPCRGQVWTLRKNALSEDVFRGRDHAFRRYAKVLVEIGWRPRLTETVNSDDCAVQSDIFSPVASNPGLNGDPWDTVRQDLEYILPILLVEHETGRE